MQLDSFNEEILCSLMEYSSLEKGPDFVDDKYRDVSSSPFDILIANILLC